MASLPQMIKNDGGSGKFIESTPPMLGIWNTLLKVSGWLVGHHCLTGQCFTACCQPVSLIRPINMKPHLHWNWLCVGCLVAA